MTPAVASPPSETEAAVATARRRLVPFLVLMYLLAYLDRANVAYAKQALQLSTGSRRRPSPSRPASSSSATRCSNCRAT